MTAEKPHYPQTDKRRVEPFEHDDAAGDWDTHALDAGYEEFPHDE